MRNSVRLTLAAALVTAAALAAPASAATLTAPSGCPTSTAAMSGSKWTGSGSNMTYDGSGTTYTQGSGNLTPVILNGSNDCLVHATVLGNYSRAEKWWQLKQCCNGAGITINAPATVIGARLDNVVVDGFRIWNHAAVTIRGAHTSYTRDDCVSDITHGDLRIDDSLFDGCHTGISWRSANKNTTAFKVNITNSLFWVQGQPGSTSGGSCTQWVVNGMANGPMWKMDSVRSGVYLENVVIRQDLGNHECADLWPSGTYKNVTFVWTNAKAYPGKLPAGVTMTRDVRVWDSAKADWLARH